MQRNDKNKGLVIGLSGIMIAATFALILSIFRVGYDLSSDQKNTPSVGNCEAGEHETKDSVVKHLYIAAKAPQYRVRWPITSFVCVVGAVIVSCGISSSFLLNTFLIFVGAYSSVCAVEGYLRTHADNGFYADLDNAYCRYMRIP